MKTLGEGGGKGLGVRRLQRGGELGLGGGARGVEGEALGAGGSGGLSWSLTEKKRTLYV